MATLYSFGFELAHYRIKAKINRLVLQCGNLRRLQFMLYDVEEVPATFSTSKYNLISIDLYLSPYSDPAVVKTAMVAMADRPPRKLDARSMRS